MKLENEGASHLLDTEFKVLTQTKLEQEKEVRDLEVVHCNGLSHSSEQSRRVETSHLHMGEQAESPSTSQTRGQTIC